MDTKNGVIGIDRLLADKWSGLSQTVSSFISSLISYSDFWRETDEIFCLKFCGNNFHVGWFPSMKLKQEMTLRVITAQPNSARRVVTTA